MYILSCRSKLRYFVFIVVIGVLAAYTNVLYWFCSLLWLLAAATLGFVIAICIVMEVIDNARNRYVRQKNAENDPVLSTDMTGSSCKLCKLIFIFPLRLYHKLLEKIGYELRRYIDNDALMEMVDSHGLMKMHAYIRYQGKEPEPKFVPGASVFVSQNVDVLIYRIFNNIYHDFIENWYSKLCNDRGTLRRLVMSDFLETYDNMSKRLKRVDIIHLVMNRLTKTFLNHFKELNASDPTKINFAPFRLHPYVLDKRCEKEFLRVISEYLIRLTFPEAYSENSSCRLLLREIISGHVLLPMIDAVCDPDCINSTVLFCISQREVAVEESRAYMYAATYEDFIKIIRSTDNIPELRQIHHHIMIELLHKTEVPVCSVNVKIKNASKANIFTKDEILLSRDLKRYVRQCQVARKQCERQIRALGGEPDTIAGHAAVTSGVYLLTYEEVMSLPVARRCFLRYLNKIHKGSLLRFWCEIDILKKTALAEEQLSNATGHIYKKYLMPGSPDLLEMEIDKFTLEGMEKCMAGNKSPEDFFCLQTLVSHTLEIDHFPSFVVSDYYICQLMPQLNDDLLGITETSHNQQKFVGHQATTFEESVIGKADLPIIATEEKLEAQACEILRPSTKLDCRLTKVLESKIGKLQNLNFQQQLSRNWTETWWSHMGRWNARIDNVSLPQKGALGKFPLYSITVNCSNTSLSETTDSEWTVARNLYEFQLLHHKLKQLQPWLRKRRVPSLPIFRFGTLSNKFINASRYNLNEYLKDVLADDVLNRSKFVCEFLNPLILENNADHTGHSCNEFAGSFLFNSHNPCCEKKKSVWQFWSLLLTLPREILDSISRSEDNSSVNEDEEENFTDFDSIATPLYELVSEVFEIQGLFRALRKTLIVLVRLAFGSTINKQIHDSIQWLVSEPMLTYYLQIFIDIVWPGGKLRQQQRKRTSEEKTLTALEARVKFLESIPEALQNLIGQENAKRGFSKIYSAFQDKQSNKHLFYNIVSEIFEEVFPEILKTE